MNDTTRPGEENRSSVQNAVALAYQTGSSAPTVVAKGKGLVAKAIIERARENGIYVHQSQELVALLMQVELDKDIPPALYRAVAELLAWLYHIEKQKSSGIITPYVSTLNDNPKLTP
jgi:flagellar biosynthesis protein